MLRVIFVGVLATSLVLEECPNKQEMDTHVGYVENKACSTIGIYGVYVNIDVQ